MTARAISPASEYFETRPSKTGPIVHIAKAISVGLPLSLLSDALSVLDSPCADPRDG